MPAAHAAGRKAHCSQSIRGYRLERTYHFRQAEIKAAVDVGSARNQKAALEAAVQTMVLLQNKGGLLPVDLATTRAIAVIGPFQNVTREMQGGYSGTNVGQGLDAILKARVCSEGSRFGRRAGFPRLVTSGVLCGWRP